MSFARCAAAPHRLWQGDRVGFRQGKLRAVLVVAEVALSIVLLIGAGLLMRSFLILTRVDLGFNPKNVLYFELVWRELLQFQLERSGFHFKSQDSEKFSNAPASRRMKAVPGVLAGAGMR